MSEPNAFSPPPSEQPRPPATPPAPPAVPPSRFSLLGCALTFSMLLNCGAAIALALVCAGLMTKMPFDNESLTETLHSGDATAKDKIAVVRVNGVLLEGLLDYPHKQIEQAAKDENVKAVVLRVQSPGGTITASDDLYRRLVKLRDGDPAKKRPAKPLVVSMGSLAASGGYYISAPGQYLYAEPTTMTGSIGVYIALPNVKELDKKIGFSMNVIKQGEVKDSGSPFGEMTPHERQIWQDSVDHSYLNFLDVVEKGRPALKGKLLEEIEITPMPGQEHLKHPEPTGPYKRYRADGGIFDADKAKQFQLVDAIGYVEDAVEEARKRANLTGSVRVVEYEKPPTLTELLLGVKARPAPANALDPARLKEGLSPRLWYLTPGYELAGVAAAMEEP